MVQVVQQLIHLTVVQVVQQLIHLTVTKSALARRSIRTRGPRS